MQRPVMGEGEAGILLQQLLQGAGQSHVVLAVAGGDGQFEHRRARRRRDPGPLRRLAGRQQVAGVDALQLAQRHDIAGVGRGDLLRGLALDTEQAADAGLLTIRQGELRAVAQRSAEHSGIGHLARLARVRGLEDVSPRPGQSQSFGRRLRLRRVVAQGLEQPPHAVALQRRAEEHRGDLAGADLGDQVGEDGVRRRGLVGQQHLHQGVVEIGHLFEHVEAGGGLLVDQLGRNLDLLGRLAGAVDEGPFQRQVDEAGDVLVLPDRQLARDQRDGADRLQGLEQVVDMAAGLVDLVDEEGARHVQRLERLEPGLDQHRLVRIGIDDHDRQIQRRQPVVAFGAVLDRARIVDEGIAVAEVAEAREVHLDRLAGLFRLGRCVAGRARLSHHALAIRGAGGVQEGFEEGRFTGAVRADQTDRPNRARFP